MARFKKNADGVLVDEQGYDPSGNKVEMSKEGKAKQMLAGAFSPGPDAFRDGHRKLPMPTSTSQTRVDDEPAPSAESKEMDEIRKKYRY